ncbi:cytochrome ubiquinol oxidase subunit I [Sinosporangium siamense]|uniref:Cytochrome ubiquinol oxidase subunit I n=1 Tax=Sinosporangium siamense TaxID=1367973 RepID=A0A919RDV7_9ACTN|nr:cytochrome ubiquinol oxidase subunit I [Sinosporangium siamense]GII92080.1 cytochrome ubiquinol oxidase subunit I [Sinosporangium siamense]
MEALDLARWQFAATTVYHFLFVPLTIGMSLVVAILQTAWVRTGKSVYLRATKFWGKLFLINFAMGVVTGIVQEFQFGMNWSEYSRFVGDIFGAPLAIEALLAFFLESVFIGLWIFGWGTLPKKLHLATIWVAAIGSVVSAYFILAANAFMQWPVGAVINRERGRAELADFGAVLSNKVLVNSFPHTLFGCFLAAGALLIAVSSWHLARRRDLEVFRPSMKLGAWAVLIGFAGTLISGDTLGKVMTETQPMKMAAAEALYETARPAPFSLFTIGTLSGEAPTFSLDVPGLLSFLATGSFNGEVQGINDLQAEYQQTYGPGNYRPYIPLAYWSFRLMIGFGALTALLALLLLWLTRRGRLPDDPMLWRLGTWSVAFPLLANSFGWIFTETARQPWIVFSRMKTADGVSPVGAGTVLTSFIVFTVLYGVLAAIEVGLMIKYAKAGPPSAEDAEPRPDKEGPLSFAY